MDPFYGDPARARHLHDRTFKNYSRFIADLEQAINNQASAVMFYRALEPLAPAAYRDFIEHARKDEMVHVQMFQKLHRRLTGTESLAKPGRTEFSSYKQGVEIAFRGELEAAEMYRDMYLSTRVQKVRDVLFRAMTDEMEHAQRFGFLYFLPDRS